MIDDKNILISSKIKRQKNKKIMRLKYDKKFKKFKKKKTLTLNMKKILIFIFLLIIIVILIFISYLLFVKNKIIKKLDFENIPYIFNYSLKYEEFDENINEKYIQLQNLFCEK